MNKDAMEPIANVRGVVENFQPAPAWIVVGTVLVCKIGKPFVAEITGIHESGNPVIEFDSDGGINDHWTPTEVASLFQPWVPGMETFDSTGKGRFANPRAWRKWWETIPR